MCSVIRPDCPDTNPIISNIEVERNYGLAMLLLRSIFKIFFFNTAFRKAMQEELFTVYVGNGMDEFLLNCKKHLKIEMKLKPPAKTFGNWFVMKLVCSAMAFYIALLEMGMDRTQAYEHVRNVVWKMSSDSGKPLYELVGLFSAPQTRLRNINRLLWAVLWSEPFRRENLREEKGIVSFDVVDCPISGHLIARNEPQLCVEAFCKIDYSLAKGWNATLERKCTIAEGCDKCDFKFENIH